MSKRVRAITEHQPYGSAIVLASKQIETRHWPTDYRGPLAIHAAKRCVKSEMISYHSQWAWCGALAAAGVRMGQNEQLWDLLPFGAIIGFVDLVDCRPTDSFTVAELDTVRSSGAPHGALVWTERMMGNFSPGRFGWVFENARALIEPVSWAGAQGFFSVPASLMDLPTRDLPTRVVRPTILHRDAFRLGPLSGYSVGVDQ